jgi:hypothetical protein
MLKGLNLIDLGRLLYFNIFICNYLKKEKEIKEIPHLFPLPLYKIKLCFSKMNTFNFTPARENTILLVCMNNSKRTL